MTDQKQEQLKRAEGFPFERVPAPLIAWYRANKRDLPWRVNPTPYRVWVSEIMLQQTRVEAAKEYYLRFLSALPTVFDLAACEEEKLLKLWEGLGYYSRVRNMQKAAKLVVENYGGEFPAEEKALKGLPGIGDYTVGAVLSIAFGLPYPAVDGNVLRVLSRVSENPSDISDTKYREFLREKLRAVYPQDRQGCSDFTQALMELGALICKPAVIECSVCPLKELCSARKNGTQKEYPVMPEKKGKREESLFVFVIETEKGIAIRKREAGVLKGMNEFPSAVVKEGDLPEETLKEWGVSAFNIVRQKKYTHIFTHIRWNMTCFFVRAEDAPFAAYSREEIEREVALPTAFKQCLGVMID
ncbi:MAG: A/G-specific adenine glycosylase [Clostridia bacterium]|nr:A/G-specific adenine glycosylase [Clostridia bacterium]